MGFASHFVAQILKAVQLKLGDFGAGLGVPVVTCISFRPLMGTDSEVHFSSGLRLQDCGHHVEMDEQSQAPDRP